jgi:hypothetical protein
MARDHNVGISLNERGVVESLLVPQRHCLHDLDSSRLEECGRGTDDGCDATNGLRWIVPARSASTFAAFALDEDCLVQGPVSLTLCRPEIQVTGCNMLKKRETVNRIL